MGEYKANTHNRRLILRLQFPTNEPMVVETDLTAEFLQRVWKLMLICQKIRRTMHGRARVVIEDAHCQYVSILSEAPIQRLLAMAGVNRWQQLQYVWIPRDLLLGRLGQCRVMAGMRRSQTIVDEDGFWFEGSDGTGNQYESARLDRDWVRQELSRPIASSLLDSHEIF